jgi:hypothetical protein
MLKPNGDPFLDVAMLLGVINRLTRQIEQARSIAALLEAECSNCWGPMHTSALDRLPEGEV